MHKHAVYASNLCICNNMRDMQFQGNSRLPGPSNTLFGRNIQKFAKQGQAATKGKGHGHASYTDYPAFFAGRAPY
jgi:hypothetical protein